MTTTRAHEAAATVRRTAALVFTAAMLTAVLAGSVLAVRGTTGRPPPAEPVHDQVATTSRTTETSFSLARKLAGARLATARYATGLGAAKADGYQVITRTIPDVGHRFLNPSIHGFDVRRPPILVYARMASSWQLVALEWAFPHTPTTPPLEGATYGSFAPACHYQDGTFVFRVLQEKCPGSSPRTGVAFKVWHPRLVTMRVWVWYPNPQGLFAETNPLLRPFSPFYPPYATP